MGAVNLRKTHLIFHLDTTFLQIMSMVVVGHSTERHYLSAVFADCHSLLDSALSADPTLEGPLLMVLSPGKSAKAEGENLRLASASPSA